MNHLETFDEIFERHPLITNSVWWVNGSFRAVMDGRGRLIRDDGAIYHVGLSIITKNGTYYFIKSHALKLELISIEDCSPYYNCGFLSWSDDEWFAYAAMLHGNPITKIDPKSRQVSVEYFREVDTRIYAKISDIMVKGTLSEPSRKCLAYAVTKAYQYHPAHYAVSDREIDLGELVSRENCYSEHYLYRISDQDIVLVHLIDGLIIISRDSVEGYRLLG